MPAPLVNSFNLENRYPLAAKPPTRNTDYRLIRAAPVREIQKAHCNRYWGFKLKAFQRFKNAYDGRVEEFCHHWSTASEI